MNKSNKEIEEEIISLKKLSVLDPSLKQEAEQIIRKYERVLKMRRKKELSLNRKKLYHKSNEKFNHLNKQKIGTNQASGTSIQGFWFFPNDNGPAHWGKYTYSAYVDVSNFYDTARKDILNKNNLNNFLIKYLPKYLNEKGEIKDIHKGYLLNKLESAEGINNLIRQAADENNLYFGDIVKSLGYDGFIQGDEYILFEPEQAQELSLIK